jgi:hypothetical protein
VQQRGISPGTQVDQTSFRAALKDAGLDDKPTCGEITMNTNEIVEVIATEEQAAQAQSAPVELTAADLDWIGGGNAAGISY